MLQDPQSVKACGVLAQRAGHEFSKCVLFKCCVLKGLPHSNMQVVLKEFLVVRIINASAMLNFSLFSFWRCGVKEAGQSCRCSDWLRTGLFRVRVPLGLRDFSLLQNVQTGSGALQPHIQ